MLRFLLLTLALFFTTQSHAQDFFANSKVGKLTSYHTVVGTTTAAAIPAASVLGSMVSWKICNDAVNTSTYLLVGTTADAATDGVMLDKGQCYECANCSGSLLKAMKVKAQAASNGYSVLQYRQ